jgi:hypothetical protein
VEAVLAEALIKHVIYNRREYTQLDLPIETEIKDTKCNTSGV